MGEKHQSAQSLSTEAAAVLAEGREDDAIELFAKAALLEKEAFGEISSGKKRTRSVLAVSFVSLFYKARQYDNAELEIFRLLGSKELLQWANDQLRELLEVIVDERILTQKLGYKYTGDIITVSLRGGEIGAGTGPLDLIIAKASGFRNLLYRFAEWIGNYPLRFRGNPPKDLLDLIQVRATQPTAGSYRLDIRLTEPMQLELYGRPPVQPKEVSDALFEFLERLNKGTRADIEDFVPNPKYRKALLELTKSVAPAGRRINEIGLSRKIGKRIQSVYLTPSLPAKVKESIIDEPKLKEEPKQELRGVLRALHLDKNWLELALADGRHEKCDTVPDMLDDVVGPMVNHEVLIRGPLRIRRADVKRLLVEEIELAEPD